MMNDESFFNEKQKKNFLDNHSMLPPPTFPSTIKHLLKITEARK